MWTRLPALALELHKHGVDPDRLWSELVIWSLDCWDAPGDPPEALLVAARALLR